MRPLLVITNVPDRDTGMKIARHLVERKLAACVNLLDGCTSVYRWQGQVETAQELPLFIKTREALYPAVEAAIRETHPYELPEIVAVGIERGLPAYLDWLAAETSAAAD